MENKPLLERLLYKYQYLEQVEKNGVIYKKYKKVNRLRFFKKTTQVVFFYLALTLIIFTIAYLMFSAMNMSVAR